MELARADMHKLDKIKRKALLSYGHRVDYLLKNLQKNQFNLFNSRLQKHHPFGASILWWRNLRNKF